MTDVKLPEPVGNVYTMEAFDPPNDVKCHVQLYKKLRAGTKLYTEGDALAIHEQGRLAGLAEAAHEAERIATEQRSAFKGRTEPIDRDKLYNPHTDGMSDGAFEVAEAIRSIAASDGGK
jgi:hypothetical protein